MKTYQIARELARIAKKSGYKVKLVSSMAVNDGGVFNEHKVIQVGVHRQGIRLPVLTFLATLAHEVGHVKTATVDRDSKTIRSIFGGCNVYTLRSELRASGWAIRFLKRHGIKKTQLLHVKRFLKWCYGTYRQNYDNSLDCLATIKKIRTR